MKKFLCVAAVVILIPLLSSCATYVRPAPPPLQTEVVGAAPYPGAVWVRGYWVWEHGGYVWVPGHWAPAPPAEVVGVAPYPGAVWVPGHYGRFGRWHPGHWRAAY